MGWNNLGSVLLNDYNWKEFQLPVVGGETFRLTQNYADKPIGWAVFAWDYSGAGKYGYRRIYPDKSSPAIIIMPIPEALQEAGLTERKGLIKMTPRTRVFEFDWAFQLEVFN